MSKYKLCLPLDIKNYNLYHALLSLVNEGCF